MYYYTDKNTTDIWEHLPEASVLRCPECFIPEKYMADGDVSKNNKTRFFHVFYFDNTWVFDQSEERCIITWPNPM